MNRKVIVSKEGVAIFRVELTGESLVIQGREVAAQVRRWGR
jgi:hypothetical protein